LSDDALLCPPDEKAEREAANGVEQLDYLTDLVVGDRAITQIRESHLLDLQKLAVATSTRVAAPIAMREPTSRSATASTSLPKRLSSPVSSSTCSNI
jgi:hypothetical protein